jgi:phage gp29-like protein
MRSAAAWARSKVPSAQRYYTPESAKNKETIIVNQINVSPIERQSVDINLWRNAMKQAEGYYQSRAALYDLYEDMMLDAQLSDAVRKRTIAITNSPLSFRKKGKEVPEVDALINTTYFQTLLQEILLAEMYGHSLVELYWPAKGSTAAGQSILVNRKHVRPRHGIVTHYQHGLEGTLYREKPYSDFTIEIGSDESLGTLLKASQYVIYKRGGFGDWAEYAEVFGMPFRWAEYDSEPNRIVLEEALAKAGSAGYVVAPTGAKLQYLTNSNTASNDVFKTLREACNEEISVCILGNTMTTTDSKRSGYAQGKVHADTQDDLHQADRKAVLRVLQEKLIPYLASLGYSVRGGKFEYVDEERITLKDRLEIDMKLSTKVPIGASYWYQRYNVPVPDPSDVIDPEPEPETEEDDNPPPGQSNNKKKSPSSSGKNKD